MVSLQGERYEYEMNMLLFLKRGNISHVEIPIEAIYIDHNRSSHFRPLLDTARIFKQFFAYSVTSLLCAGADYLLYALFAAIGFLTPFAYAGARLCSAAMNFSINRAKVFHNGYHMDSAAKYALLVLANIGAGSFCANILTGAGLPGVLAKLLVDTVLFAANYYIQKRLVFV
jgi:putative flippase GtrA